MSGKVLLVDDEQAFCELFARGLRKQQFDCSYRTSSAAALEALAVEDFDVVVTDINMPGQSGLELCTRIVENRPDVPVVVITAFGSFDAAVSAIRAGAYDFVTKPLEVEALALVVERAVQHRALREEVKRLRRVVDQAQRFDEFIGTSPATVKLHRLLAQIVDSEASVLITGESGTGKEVVARALHRRGRRLDGPFVAVNCAAVPETLLESELFGHMRGAFTGASGERAGLFVRAHRGTLFLDEIGEMPMAMQAKLLRALQERTVRPVGSDREVPFDVRLITATNRDLESAIAEHRFREDLYFRINVLYVAVPSLRERAGDVLLLGKHFLDDAATRSGKRVKGISPAAAARLCAYAWPGNVRELQNCIERAVAMARFEEITVEDLPERIQSYRPAHVLVVGEDPSELVPMEQVERRYITRVMEAVGGNKSLAARVLGFDRKTLYNKLDRFGLSTKPPA